MNVLNTTEVQASAVEKLMTSLQRTYLESNNGKKIRMDHLREATE